ncbi:MAG: lyase family protein, partial [Usitatibacteraceae bacterium]
INLPDRFCYSSSIMPQKKNPDVPELIRGKTGRVNGHLVALLTLMKGQPLAYNKDNQEDKEPLFDTVDTVRDSLLIMTDLSAAIEVRPDRMAAAVERGFATATDLADYLVKKGLAFRDAHEAVARAVRDAEKLGKDLSELPIEVLRGYSALVGEDVYSLLSAAGSVASRDHIGGPAPRQVRLATERARVRLGK